MHPASEKVLEAARRLGIQIDIRQFDQSTRTAQEAADAIGVSLGQIVKSLVFLADGHPILVLASGPNRTDTAKLARQARARVPCDPSTAPEASLSSLSASNLLRRGVRVCTTCSRSKLSVVPFKT